MKVAIVTGAGTGIGAATATRLAESGYAVILVGRRRALLDEVAGNVAAAGGQSRVVAADLADPGAGAHIVGEAVQAFGRIDALVNNAATIKVMPLAAFPLGVIDDHWAVNVRAPLLLIQASLPHLRESKGAIVNISSSSGTLVRPGQSVYGMTKAALEYLTRSLAGELAPDRVRVNALALGPVNTPIHKTWAVDLDAAYEWLNTQVPLGRIGNAHEVARWIELLIGTESAWITGAVIPFDDGQVLAIV